MNRKDFIRYVADKYGMTYTDTRQWVFAIMESMGDVFASGEDLMITNLGLFYQHITPPKVGRNSKTGERVDIPPRNRVKFKPCPTLQAQIDERFELSQRTAEAEFSQDASYDSVQDDGDIDEE